MPNIYDKVLDSAIRRALANEDTKAVVRQIEQAVLFNQPVALELLERLPVARIQASPLLSKAHAEALLRSGRLLPAREKFVEVLPRLAAGTLKTPMLSALALLALVHIRTGQLPEAEPIVKFLQGERNAAEEEAGGDVIYALAKGCPLLYGSASDMQYRLYGEAVAAYDKEGSPQLAAWVHLEQLADQDEACGREEWKIGLAALEQRAARGEIDLSGLAYLRADQAWLRSEPLQARLELECYPEEMLVALPYPWGRKAILLRKMAALPLEIGAQASLTTEQPDVELRFAELMLQWMAHAAFCSHEERISSLQQLRRLGDAGLLARTKERLQVLERLARERADSGTNIPRSNTATAVLPPQREGAWRVSLFGRLRLHRGADSVEEIKWKRGKAKELLLFLLLQPEYAARRELAAESLFPDCTADQSGNRFYVAVHELKLTLERYLGAVKAVEVRGGIIRLKEGLIEEVDVERYKALYRTGSQLWPTERVIARNMFARAEPLYDRLEMMLNEARWLEQADEQLLAMQMNILGKLYETELDDGNPGQAEGRAREMIRLQPYEEAAYRPLLRLLSEQQRTEEAGSVFWELERLLAVEYGTAPSEETRAAAGRMSL